MFFAGNHPLGGVSPVGVDAQAVGAASLVTHLADPGSLHVVAPRAMGVVSVLVGAGAQKVVLQVSDCVARGLVLHLVVLRVGGHELWGFSCVGIASISSIAFSR